MRAKIEQAEQDFAYQIYMTEAAKAITNNSARANGGTEITMRWADLIDAPPVDNRSGDEIALDIITKAGLKRKGEEE